MAETTTPPNEDSAWHLVKVPQVKPGDAVISASSGRILQNKEGKVTEVPNGLRVPWVPEAHAEMTTGELMAIINGLRAALLAYNMIEADEEIDPE